LGFNDLGDKKAVEKAIAEFDRIGRDAFLEKYGFGRARMYFLELDGKRYDSKAIVGAAFGFQFGAPLSSGDFGGGEATVKRKLKSLGFQVVKVVKADGDDQASALAEEIPDSASEGAKRTITVNRYERSTKARLGCIKHHGSCCVVCGFDFSAIYGKIFKGFIYVHHVVPLSSIGKRYQVNPITDLIPVCANCHAAIHYGGETRSINEMKNLVRGRVKAGI
jgi:5-methylcytosine-specific restriction protein A